MQFRASTGVLDTALAGRRDDWTPVANEEKAGVRCLPSSPPDLRTCRAWRVSKGDYSRFGLQSPFGREPERPSFPGTSPWGTLPWAPGGRDTGPRRRPHIPSQCPHTPTPWPPGQFSSLSVTLHRLHLYRPPSEPSAQRSAGQTGLFPCVWGRRGSVTPCPQARGLSQLLSVLLLGNEAHKLWKRDRCCLGTASRRAAFREVAPLTQSASS